MGYRAALVTGASSGIGAALARQLASMGLEVGLAARQEARLRELAAEIEREGGRARVYPLDVRDPERVESVLRRADDEMQGIDLVVANAGVADSKAWAGQLCWDACQHVIGVNVIGAVATLTALVPRMVERGQGHLVGISSLAGYRGLPRNATYCASKAFLSTFLESLRVDLADRGLVVTDIRPGWVRTPLVAGNRYRMPWMLEPEDAAARILGAILAQRAVYAFPWPTATAIRAAALLPAGLYTHLMRLYDQTDPGRENG